MSRTAKPSSTPSAFCRNRHYLIFNQRPKSPVLGPNNTVPDSRHFKLCHYPFSIFRTTSPGTVSVVTVRLPCSSQKYSSKSPLMQTQVSELFLCLCMAPPPRRHQSNHPDCYSFIFVLTPSGNRWNIQHSVIHKG